MARLHLKYREDKFDPRLVELTRRFVNEVGPWRGDLAFRKRLFETWLHGACIVYGNVDPPVLHLLDVRPQDESVGRYVKAEEDGLAQIVLPHPSIVSLFHQFRHHLQASADPEWEHDDKSQEAQQWACSLYYVVNPRRFRRAVRRRRVVGVTPADLLKRAAA